MPIKRTTITDLFINGYKIWHNGNILLSLTDSGYIKLPNGLIIQWGTGQINNGGPITFNFPISFPNTCLQLVATDVGVGCHSIGISPISNAQFQAWSRDAAGNVPSATGIRWIAIGY